MTLFSPLFPGVPAPSVVIYVVKNASRPVSGELSPVPDRKRLAFLCGVYCNSEQTVMQVVSAKAAAQMLSRNKPAKKSSPNSKKSYRQKKSIAKQRRQSGSLGRLK